MIRGLVPFIAGVLFATGLALGGMTDPKNVLAFLDLTGRWDPRLAFVMGGAIATHFLVARWALRAERPLLGERFHLPPISAKVDKRLLAGAALFGVGWGIAGYCPGPAIVSLVHGGRALAAFAAAMLSGLAAVRWLERRRASVVSTSDPSVRAPSPSMR
jgi:uncharacterized membrane protein YedE/YeeE